MTAAVAADARWRTTLEHMAQVGRIDPDLAAQLLSS